jgi:membrane dipeptidase
MVALSKAPIIASHSSARALCDHSRNLDDEQLEWLKENGGVVQTVAFQSYVNKEKDDARNEALKVLETVVMDSLGKPWMPRKEIMALPSSERTSYLDTYIEMMGIVKKKAKSMPELPPAVNVQDFVDHIDYLVGKIGLQHVGISSDFDGGGGVEGWSNASETFNVTLELVKRGYTEEQIGLLWSGNLLRVLDEVQAVASNMN